jgi:hypothetical protein
VSVSVLNHLENKTIVGKGWRRTIGKNSLKGISEYSVSGYRIIKRGIYVC